MLEITDVSEETAQDLRRALEPGWEAAQALAGAAKL